MKHVITLTAAVVALAASAVSAHAGCVDPRQAVSGGAHIIPDRALPKAAVAATAVPSTAAHSIVGTWVVTYTNNGLPFGQAIIQWHDDGTEWENINLPVASGNMCLGSWKPIDNLQVYRSHMGWLYNAGTLVGYFLETETDKVPTPASYTGVNHTRLFDLSGNQFAEVYGTSSAVRLGP